jgi:hypothetical protein
LVATLIRYHVGVVDLTIVLTSGMKTVRRIPLVTAEGVEKLLRRNFIIFSMMWHVDLVTATTPV